MFKWLGSLLCWWGYHKWGEPWEMRHEYLEVQQTVTFVTCKRCGMHWRIL
jgi:hypothetical protein